MLLLIPSVGGAGDAGGLVTHCTTSDSHLVFGKCMRNISARFIPHWWSNIMSLLVLGTFSNFAAEQVPSIFIVE